MKTDNLAMNLTQPALSVCIVKKELNQRDAKYLKDILLLEDQAEASFLLMMLFFFG